MLRAIVSALLALSLMPGVDAAVASFVHLVHDGHFLHTDAHDAVAASEECPSDCSEDGCTPLAHHCSCCATVFALAPAGAPSSRAERAPTTEKYRANAERSPPNAGVEPYLPPPIA